VVAAELGMGLAQRGHEVHFITYAQPGRLDTSRSGIFYHQVMVPDYPLFEYAPYSQALAGKIAACAIEQGIQLIHAHYAIPHAASAILARNLVGGNRLKVVTTLHGTDITLVGKDPSFLRLTRYAIEQSDEVSAVSAYLTREVCRTFTCDAQLRTIYNFIDPRRYDQPADESVRMRFAPAGEKLLIHVSNYRPVKRVDDVVEIFLRVVRKMPCRLILVGAGPDLTAAENRISRAGQRHNLILLGNIERVESVVSVSDLFLLPSENESFGLAALEAMACGVPVIATNAGGVPEVVSDGESGFLFPVGDVDGMAGKAVELLSDSELHSRIGRQARTQAFERFPMDLMLDHYERMYADALSR